MITLLFTNEGSPFKPGIAAACVLAQGIPSIQAAVAATSDTQPGSPLRKALRRQKLSWPETVYPFDQAPLSSYDLIISFSNGSGATYPALPGNPAVVYWEVPDPDSHSTPEAWDKLCVRIKGLVDDLLQQGFLAAMVHARRNAELIMDNLPVGILAHDLSRKIFFFNRAAEQITGFRRKEILGRDCHAVFAQGFCRSNCSFCETKTFPEIPSTPYALTFTTKSGDSKQLEMTVVSINNFLDNPIGVVASFTDLTREQELASRLGEIQQFAGIIGRDSSMQELYGSIRDLADSNVPVLLQGESGTGKELVAAAIHNEGGRAGKLFVPINCGALPENLLESELFGHVKGAFTGAIRDKKGRFELADGGTLFLDEIGDISPAMQVKLLRVLQDGTFQRVGGDETRTVDVRIISATHKDLQKEIRAGRFREDLYYRLCVVPLNLAPLRQRPTDIPLLVDHFLKRFAKDENREAITISPETMDLLIAYEWPGNIRELQNVIRYILVRCRETIATPAFLPPNFLAPGEAATGTRLQKTRRRGKLNAAAVRQALAEAKNNRTKAATLLKVGRATLYRFLDRHPLD